MANKPPVKTHDSLVADFLLTLRLERGLSANTIAGYGSDLRDYFERTTGVDASQLGQVAVVRYIGLLTSTGAKPSTIARRLASIRQFQTFLTERGLLSKTKVAPIRSPKLTSYHPDALTVTEIDSLFSSLASKNPPDIRARAICELLYGCGLRISELLALRISDLELAAGFVKVTGKGNKQRLVPLGQPAVDALIALTRDQENTGEQSADLLFPGRFQRPMSRVGMWKIVKKLVAEAGITRRVSPHTFRHSFATHLLAGGSDLRSVQEMLGHADISTTEVYTRLDRDYLITEHRQFHPRELAGFASGTKPAEEKRAALRRAPKRRQS